MSSERDEAEPPPAGAHWTGGDGRWHSFQNQYDYQYFWGPNVILVSIFRYISRYSCDFFLLYLIQKLSNVNYNRLQTSFAINITAHKVVMIFLFPKNIFPLHLATGSPSLTSISKQQRKLFHLTAGSQRLHGTAACVSALKRPVRLLPPVQTCDFRSKATFRRSMRRSRPARRRLHPPLT